MPHSTPARATRAGGLRRSEGVMDSCNRKARHGHVGTRTHFGTTEQNAACADVPGHNDRVPNRVTCPCCGHRTLTAAGDYELCPVCGWEDDGASRDRPLVYDGGPNGISLAQAQRRYQRYGCSYPEDPNHRSPRPDEPRDPEWTPADDPTADPVQDYLHDLTYIVTVRAGKARDHVRGHDDERTRGRLDTWREVVELLVSQAEIFGLSLDDIGLPGGTDPDQDFDPDTPRWYGG